jgi:four helix bundle protein
MLPATERFELSSQMRRASISVPSNIAEGQSCGEDGRYIHHLRVALGSLGELSTQLELAVRLAMVPDRTVSETQDHLARTGQVLNGLLRSRLNKRRALVASTFAISCLVCLLSLSMLG